ncbi:HU family DNA-binding protein [uncultured Fusobacterium sp.]|uniref:HU family DNA-binding protein n=1 Tax=uncultured Fusobacterium sp. TaxID=159267 RepID=UPI0027DDEEC6|nr:HU family DNA-binding protein [uncultured Fusobacterium sp.]
MELILMNKRELAKVYSETSKEEISLSKAQKEIEIFLETVQEALQKSHSIMFRNIGIFEVRKRKARIIANPVNKEPMKIYPRKTVKFRESKNMMK